VGATTELVVAVALLGADDWVLCGVTRFRLEICRRGRSRCVFAGWFALRWRALLVAAGVREAGADGVGFAGCEAPLLPPRTEARFDGEAPGPACVTSTAISATAAVEAPESADLRVGRGARTVRGWRWRVLTEA
jgi:hypothetical protein